MKNLFKNSLLLTISLLMLNNAAFAATEPALSANYANTSNPTLLERAKAWWQNNTANTANSANSTLSQFGENARVWLSQKLGYEISPEQFQQTLSEIKSRINNATPEQKAEVRNAVQQKAADLQEKIRTATPEQKAQFQDKINQLRALISERLFGTTTANQPAAR